MFSLSENIPMLEVKRPSVRRRLFEPERSKMLNCMETQEKEIDEIKAKEFKERWGFDPVTGKPVESGKFEFSAGDPSTMPSFYFKSYTARKSRPVTRVTRSPTPSLKYLFDCGRPLAFPGLTAKRKLDLSDVGDDEAENDENTYTSPSQQSQPAEEQPWNSNCAKRGIVSSVVSSPSPSGADSTLCESSSDDSRDSHGLSRSSSTPSLHELSPTTMAKDIATPPTRSKSLILTTQSRQSSIKDYLPLKKPRISKPLPRP